MRTVRDLEHGARLVLLVAGASTLCAGWSPPGPPRPEGEYSDLVPVAPFVETATRSAEELKREQDEGTSKTFCAADAAWSWELTPGFPAPHLKLVSSNRPARKDLLPFDPAEAPLTGTGTRSVLQVEDGWLVGRDAGGLWWFSPDGRQTAKLTDAPIHGFTHESYGHDLALEGHRGKSDDGSVLEVTRGLKGWETRTLVKLPAAPWVWVVESDGSLLVATNHGLTRVRRDGSTLDVHDAQGALYPESMAMAQDGTLYLGARFAVIRLTPKKTGGYTEEWLVLPECRETRVKDFGCQCLGARPSDPALH